MLMLPSALMKFHHTGQHKENERNLMAPLNMTCNILLDHHSIIVTIVYSYKQWLFRSLSYHRLPDPNWRLEMGTKHIKNQKSTTNRAAS